MDEEKDLTEVNVENSDGEGIRIANDVIAKNCK